MNTLDSPVEALAFNYLRFDKLWTWWPWVAVLTVAVSFWKIKVPSLSPPSKTSSELCQTVLSSSSLQVERVPAEPRPASGEPSTASRTTTSFSSAEVVGGSMKGKFAAYFGCYDERAGNEVENFNESNGSGDDHGGEGDVLVKELGKEWYESWERVMKTRMGEMGWYRYQDITAIDGNVVRLWGGGCRRRSTAALVGVGCVVTTW